MGSADHKVELVDSFSSSQGILQPNFPISSTSGASTGMSVQSGEPTIADLASQFKQLLNQTTQMHQEFSQFMNAVNGSRAPVAPAKEAVESPTVEPTSAPVTKLKVCVPDTFNGNLAKSEGFIYSLILYFYGNPGLADYQKVTMALSYMKGGTAGQWSKRMIKQYSKKGTFPSWDEFLEDFRKSFTDPDPQGTASHKLRILKQGNGSCEEYVASFKELMDDSGYNEAALMVEFERGLSRSLTDKIYNLEYLPRTLDGWMEQALKFDRYGRQKEERQRLNHPTSHSSQPRPPSHTQPATNTTPKPLPTPTKPSTSDVVPMEIDASRKKLGPKLCYRCKQPGHFARDCRSNFDINAMDYSSLRAHFKKVEEEEKTKEGDKDTPKQDF